MQHLQYLIPQGETAMKLPQCPAAGKQLMRKRNGVLWPQEYGLVGKSSGLNDK